MLDFRKINFGKTDGNEESRVWPELLKNGYLDIDSVVDQALNSRIFLFLGYKGSGKTALSEHIKLISSECVKTNIYSLKDFPYKTFGKLVSGDIESETKYKLTWRWLLLILVLKELCNDEKAICGKQSELDKTIEILTQADIFPIMNISDLVRKSSTRSFKAEVMKISIEHTSSNENANVSFEWMIDYVKSLILCFSEMSKYTIVIDGLDEILTSNEIQYKTIVALINEIRDINNLFCESSFPIKICVLCRIDIFERLPDPNKNKIRRDSSYSFDWYEEGAKSSESKLIAIANKRTQLIYSDVDDMFATFFPKYYRNNKKGIETEMLEYTRHTPRDFLQLLISIQKKCKSNRIEVNDIDKGISDFSIEYFLPEIKDEMVGYIPYRDIDNVINALGALHSSKLTFSQFSTSIANYQLSDNITPIEIMKILYDCSAIGHQYSNGIFEFKYRNRNSTFNPGEDIVIHKGLRKALNLDK